MPGCCACTATVVKAGYQNSLLRTRLPSVIAYRQGCFQSQSVCQASQSGCLLLTSAKCVTSRHFGASGALLASPLDEAMTSCQYGNPLLLIWRGAAGIWAHRPHGENQLPFLGRSKRETIAQQAEDGSENDAPANQHNTIGIWRLLSCMPAVGLEDITLPTEDDEQHMAKIQAHLPAPSSTSTRVSA